jgi:hypothetical protein
MPNASLFGISLNPGLFTFKNVTRSWPLLAVQLHMLWVQICANYIDTAYGISYTSMLYFHLFLHTHFQTQQWLLITSAQLTGLSIDDILDALYTQETTDTRAHGGISREHCFTYVYFFYSQHSSLSLHWRFVLSHDSCPLRLLALLSLHNSLQLFMAVLDCSQQCQDQTVVTHGLGWAS